MLDEILQLFGTYPRPYWVAGGWALDLYAGRVRREHEDVDVLVLARDLPVVAETFGEDLLVEDQATDQTRPWRAGEPLRPGPDVILLADGVQLLLAASEGDDWVYHRGRGAIRRPLAEVTERAPNGMPYLAPELVLLFKANGDREKDDADFHDVAGQLEPERARWLRQRLEQRRPDHSWLDTLRQRTAQ